MRLNITEQPTSTRVKDGRSVVTSVARRSFELPGLGRRTVVRVSGFATVRIAAEVTHTTDHADNVWCVIEIGKQRTETLRYSQYRTPELVAEALDRVGMNHCDPELVASPVEDAFRFAVSDSIDDAIGAAYTKVMDIVEARG